MPSDAEYERDPGRYHPDPGPGPYCCYCQFGRTHGELVIELPPGWTSGSFVPPENIYHQACKDFYPEFLEMGGMD